MRRFLPALLALAALSGCSLVNDFDSLPVPGASDAGAPTGDAGPARPDSGLPAEVDCTNGDDDNGDGFADCWDPTCAEETCLGGVCDPQVGCRGGETSCGNGLDDDADGQFDCADSDCPDQGCANGGVCDSVGCAGGERLCDGGEDDDGDGATDCADPDCAAFCAPKEICENGTDDDGDGKADCADGDCEGSTCAKSGRCVKGSCLAEWDCADGYDDSGDGMTDCQDVTFCDSRACFNGGVCTSGRCEGGETGLCGDLQDNDGDGLTDCGDADCGCGSPEVCDNGKDDDVDSLTDCADQDCAGKACGAGRVCHASACALACNPAATTIGPAYGPGVCSYGERCDLVACASSALPGTTCSGAGFAPTWDMPLHGPVIVGVSAASFSGSQAGASTWCVEGHGGFYVDVDFYAPNGLKTGTWSDRTSQIRFLKPDGTQVGPAIAEDFPADGKIGRLRTGVCGPNSGGLPFADYAVFLIDQTGASGNAACL